jgi:hypothetical protein
VPIDGSAAAVKLNPALTSADQDVFSFFRISADSTTVVYTADQDINGATELYSVPIDGSAAAVKLNPAFTSADQDVFSFFRISADSTTVVYTADQDINGATELYSVPIDGSSAAVKLNPAFTSSDQFVFDFNISADSTTVVYAAVQDINDTAELYSVPIDGSAAAVKLNPAFTSSDQFVFDFSADSTTVVYAAVQDINDTAELYSVPIGGGAVVKLNPAFTSADQDVFNFLISADSTTVVYRADQDINNAFELYSVPIDGSAAAVKLNPAFTSADQDVFSFFRISADSTTVVYRADQDINNAFELYSVPIGGGAAVKLHSDFTSSVQGVVFDFNISADSLWVVFRGDLDTDNVIEVYSSSLTIESTIDSVVSPMESIESLALPKKVENALLAPLKGIQKKLEDSNPDNDKAVCGKLDAFIHIVEEKVAANQLDGDDGAELIEDAEHIKTLVGC